MTPLELDHIAIALPRLADAPAFLVGVLGGAPYMGADDRAYRWGQWRFANGGRLEILEPRGTNGFLHRFLEVHGPGIHHVTFKVPSLDEACARAARHGYEIVARDESNPEWKEAFLHPRQAQGLVIQLAEPGPGGGGPLRGWMAPPGPASPPPAASVLGLRTRSRSAERASRQWGDVLLGEAVESAAHEIVYRWPGSPLRVIVEIAAAAEEGPQCVDVAAERRLALPAGRHPVLGAVFRQVPVTSPG